ncbi:MAG: sulfatase-like hydrolase/transferase [Lachnospiraceae bacterium]|nr:sulfatase-like hydrolase/transferase [Lachnospiraceae bacterium]
MNTIKDYLKKHKAQAIKAAIWGVIMVAVFAFFYIMKAQNEFYVSLKTKVIVVGTVLVSVLLVFFRIRIPKWLSNILEVTLIIGVPFYSFYALEGILQTMEMFKPEAGIYNVLIIFGIYAIVFAIFQHAGISVGVASAIVYVLYLVDYFTVAFRGTPFILSDILSAKTAAGVAGNYKFVLHEGMISSFYVLSLFCSMGFFVSEKKKKPIKRLIIAGTSFTAGVSVLLFLIVGNSLPKKGFSATPFSPMAAANRNGFPVNTIISLKDSFLQKPEGYSSKAVEDIIEKYESHSTSAVPSFKPNLIVVMNESFTDLDYLETAVLSEDPIPKFKALSENCVKGTLVPSIFGGNTPNSEFEFLTGCSLAFLPSGIVTYQQLISDTLPTIVDFLEKYDYKSSAIHLFNPEYFSRSRIYPLLGFDEFIHFYNTNVNVDFDHPVIYDSWSFEAVEQQYEQDKDNPVFTFCVTMQNHGGYTHGFNDIQVLNGNSEYANDYASVLRMTDDAFEDLLDYFSHVDEPTLIIMYGDHQPNLSDEFYASIWAGCDYTDEEKFLMKQKVPFVIWANYDIEEKDLGTMSINYLGPAILETAGLPMSDYFNYLNNLRKTLPVISATGFIDAKGNYFTDPNKEEYKDLLKEYSFLQYNYLKGNVNKNFYK